jgi:hypothetical protein
LNSFSDTDTWIAAHIKVAEKWEVRMAGIGRPKWGVADENWRQRARIAEAEAGLPASSDLDADAAGSAPAPTSRRAGCRLE